MWTIFLIPNTSKKIENIIKVRYKAKFPCRKKEGKGNTKRIKSTESSYPGGHFSDSFYKLWSSINVNTGTFVSKPHLIFVALVHICIRDWVQNSSASLSRSSTQRFFGSEWICRKPIWEVTENRDMQLRHRYFQVWTTKAKRCRIASCKVNTCSKIRVHWSRTRVR